MIVVASHLVNVTRTECKLTKHFWPEGSVHQKTLLCVPLEGNDLGFIVVQVDGHVSLNHESSLQLQLCMVTPLPWLASED